MENHATRPEVLDAFQGAQGESQRLSTTLRQDMLYGAVMAANNPNLVVRAAMPVSHVLQILQFFDRSLALMLFSLGVVLTGVAAWASRAMVSPMGYLLAQARDLSGQPAAPASQSESYGEWSELETSLEEIRRDLAFKAERLSVEREELATLMGAISDAILAIDIDGRPLFYNSRFALLFGHEDRLGKRDIRLHELFRAPEVLEAFAAALRQGRSGAVPAIAIDALQGTYFSLSVSPLRKGSFEVYGAVGVFHDVTELKSAEQIRIDFVANVSHELRTPLTAIKGYTDTLINDMRAGTEPDPAFLETIARNTDRLISLIGDLLDLSSLESADILHKSRLDTQEVTARILKQLQGKFDAKSQKVTASYRATSVFGDPRRLEQVLVNLLDNANKYTPAQGEITVSWEPQGTDVLLKVKDSGPGIPPEHHARLFERFYRIDKARSRDLGGTGLGLAIVKHILQRHEGAVWVESTIGKGSTFVCRFPGATKISRA
jgi:two-component system phosphate regulon sensor histidine kinase PhoR